MILALHRSRRRALHGNPLPVDTTEEYSHLNSHDIRRMQERRHVSSKLRRIGCFTRTCARRRRV